MAAQAVDDYCLPVFQRAVDLLSCNAAIAGKAALPLARTTHKATGRIPVLTFP
jgi:hypothetical protein